MKSGRAALFIALTASIHTTRVHAQHPSDDPFAPRNSVTYMSSDFVRQLARVRVFDPSSSRVQRNRIPMGDVRFGASPSLHVAPRLSLAVDGGVSARFLLDHSHLVSTDWIILGMVAADVGVPRIAKDVLCDVGSACSLQIAAGVRHLSAHGGDEFMEVEKLPFLVYSRDGYVARVALETARIGGRFEINDDVRTYGLYPSTEVMGELWVRPLRAFGLRVGVVQREIPGIETAYQALYAALPFRVSNQRFEIRGRMTRGAVPIGYAYGSLEHAAQIELVIR